MPDPVVSRSPDGAWIPGEHARGPFAGLQGGVVAALLVGELEQEAATAGLGGALSSSTHFLRPAPLQPLTTRVTTLRRGKRISVLHNQLHCDGELLAVSTVTFATPASIADVQEGPPQRFEPDGYPAVSPRPAPHGGPWFMDTLDVRRSEDGVSWFGIERPVVSPLTPMAKVLGPADWTHGLARPAAPRLADPNIDLVVQLTRGPVGDWIGVRPSARWTRAGVGRGHGVLYDVTGEIGAVSMGVTLVAP